MSIEPGTKLGHYEIVEPIGAGGMGEVYRARDTKLGRDVAIKVLPDEVAHDVERLSRFEREAKLLAALNHPGIATLYGVEEHEGKPFLVMELVDGETLAERIARARIPASEAIPLFVHIAEALEAAHGKGIVHRDLKPPNIKITSDGNPKLLDFGLARAFHDEEPHEDASQSPTLTKNTALGTILGTAAYMSPEQARGKTVDKRTDNWAFGCCLCEVLTGKAVFRAGTVSDTIANVLQREPDWSALPADTPATVRDLLKWCMEKDPKRRLRDIGDALRALDDRASSATMVAPASWMNRRPDTTPRPVVRFIAETIPFQSYIGGERILDISPDGSRLVYIDDNDVSGAPQLFLRNLHETTATPIRGTVGAMTPFFSADGKSVAFFARDDLTLMVVSLQGGAPAEIAEAGSARGADWTEDDTIVFQYSEQIWQISSSGGEPRQITSVNTAKKEQSHRYADALPDSRGVLYAVGDSTTDSWDDANINYVSLETGDTRTLLEGGTAPRYVPTGHIVFARARNLLAVPFDLETLEITGSPSVVVDNVQMNPLSGSARFAISETGTLAHIPGGSQPARRRLVWVDRAGNVERLGTAKRPLRHGPSSWSPDGKYLAYTEFDPSTAGDIWILSAGEETPRPFLQTPYREHQPDFSPDGRFIAYTSNESGRDQVYVRSFPSGDQRWQISTDGGLEPRWSRDGRELFFRIAGGEEMMYADVSTEPDFRPGRARILFEGMFSTYASSGPSYSLHPDGKRFLMLQDILPDPAPIVITLNWFEELKRLVPTE